MKNWFIIFRPDGEILASSGKAPETFIGEDIQQVALDPKLTNTAKKLLNTWRDSDPHASHHEVVDLDQGETVDLCVLEAIRITREATDVKDFVQTVLAPLESQVAATDTKLKIQFSEAAIPTVYLDVEKIGWILTTLVGNAIRYSRHGGWLRPGSSIKIKIAYLAQENTLSLIVKDEGPGIPADRVQHLFSPKPNLRSLSGLALRIAFDFVAAHGGKMTVKSSTGEDEHGTEFQILIPNTVPKTR